MSRKTKFKIAYLLFLLIALIIPTIGSTLCKYKSDSEFTAMFRNDVYDLFYEIRDANGNIKVTSDKTLENYRNYPTEYEGFTLNNVFGEDRQQVVYTGSFRFTATINIGYEADVYYLEAKNTGKNADGDITYLTNDKGEYLYNVEEDESGNWKENWNKKSHKATSKDFDILDRSDVPYVSLNEGYSLGTEPVYDNSNKSNLVPDTSKGPSFCNLTCTGYLRDVTTVWKIVIQIDVRKNEPIFDIRDVLQSNQMGGGNDRGAWGVDNGVNGRYFPDLDPKGNWGWGDVKQHTQSMTKNTDKNSIYYGTYSYDFTFQTNTQNCDFILDNFEINGFALTLPFIPKDTFWKIDPVPRATYELDKKTDDPKLHTKITYISDGINSTGMKVSVTYIRAFTSGSSEIQRAYRVLIEGARTNVIVTSANLHQYTGAPEIIVYSLRGVANNTVEMHTGARDPYNALLSTVFVMQGDWANLKCIKFKLADFYENPTISITRKNGNAIDKDDSEKVELSEPDEEGYYTISGLHSITSLKGGIIALLNIDAEPMRYAVQYRTNDEVVPMENVFFLREDEWFKDWYDDNNGQYYTIENAATLSFHDFVPYDMTRKYVFDYWKAEKGNEGEEGYDSFEIHSGESFRFDRLLHYAVQYNGDDHPLYEDGIWIITITAEWVEQINPDNPDHKDESGTDSSENNALKDAYDENYEEWAQMPFDEWYAECWEKYYSKYLGE